jgi:ribosome-binding factor A
MQPFKRTDRASSVIKDALSRIILTDLADPKAARAVVTHVKVSADFSIARVNVRCMESQENARLAMLKALRKSSSFLRKRLALELNLFRTPELIFHYDDVPDKGARIDSLLNTLPPVRTMADVAADEGFDKENLFDSDSTSDDDDDDGDEYEDDEDCDDEDGYEDDEDGDEEDEDGDEEGDDEEDSELEKEDE